MRKILIIEDNIDLALNIEYVLKKEGYGVFLAHDGEDGFQKYRTENPDLVLPDLRLPKLSGDAICRRIRRSCNDEQTAIVMLTGKNQEADRIIGKVLGADVYLTKPFEFPDLLKAIRGHIGKKTNSQKLAS
jgi:DNA-binding response OmpR family regulator